MSVLTTIFGVVGFIVVVLGSYTAGVNFPVSFLKFRKGV